MVWTVQVAPELPEGLWALMGPSLRTGLGQVRTAWLVGRGHSVRRAVREAELEGTGGTPRGKANSREESENCSSAWWVGLFSAEETVPKPPELSRAVSEYSTVSTFTDTVPFTCVGGCDGTRGDQTAEHLDLGSSVVSTTPELLPELNNDGVVMKSECKGDYFHPKDRRKERKEGRKEEEEKERKKGRQEEKNERKKERKERKKK